MWCGLNSQSGFREYQARWQIDSHHHIFWLGSLGRKQVIIAVVVRKAGADMLRVVEVDVAPVVAAATDLVAPPAVDLDRQVFVDKTEFVVAGTVAELVVAALVGRFAGLGTVAAVAHVDRDKLAVAAVGLVGLAHSADAPAFVLVTEVDDHEYFVVHHVVTVVPAVESFVGHVDHAVVRDRCLERTQHQAAVPAGNQLPNVGGAWSEDESDSYSFLWSLRLMANECHHMDSVHDHHGQQAPCLR